MLEKKTVLVGVTGGIAAYKIPNLVSHLVREGADVYVIMTKNACNFVNPITFETLTGHRCIVDTFDRNHEYNVEHVALAKKADVFMVAPATADIIAKFAYGIADDMLTTTFLACDCPKYVAPAMNTKMFANPATQANITTLKKYGVQVIEPASGHLACGDTGAGKMPEPETLYCYIERQIARPKDLAGKKVLVSAGATCEAIDPVRYITNHSTGKMGFAIAKECMLRGADVIIVKAMTSAEIPMFCYVVDAVSAAEMYKEITTRSEAADIIIMAAAVSDYTPANVADEKVKKTDGDMSIKLKRTLDILAYLGTHSRDGQFLCGFSMETQDMLENSKAKLIKKNVNMIVANNLKDAGAGFGTDTNLVTLITPGDVKQLELMGKDQVAKAIIDEIVGK